MLSSKQVRHGDPEMTLSEKDGQAATRFWSFLVIHILLTFVWVIEIIYGRRGNPQCAHSFPGISFDFSRWLFLTGVFNIVFTGFLWLTTGLYVFIFRDKDFHYKRICFFTFKVVH
jgi:hypothetical protein